MLDLLIHVAWIIGVGACAVQPIQCASLGQREWPAIRHALGKIRISDKGLAKTDQVSFAGGKCRFCAVLVKTAGNDQCARVSLAEFRKEIGFVTTQDALVAQVNVSQVALSQFSRQCEPGF